MRFRFPSLVVVAVLLVVSCGEPEQIEVSAPVPESPMYQTAQQHAAEEREVALAGAALYAAVTATNRERIAEEALRVAEERKAAEERQDRTEIGTAVTIIREGCTDGSPLPDHIIYRESRGDCDAVNESGCSGRTCVGFAQIDEGHFAAVSPWNPNVSGRCYGRTYEECVALLWDNGNGCAHWNDC